VKTRLHTIFLVSPANLGGERAQLVFNPAATFSLARQLRSAEGAALGDVFSFVSGLYFRGKATYALAFGRPPGGLPGGLVISPSEGLRFMHERVTRQRLLDWAAVSIDKDNPLFTVPLVESAFALDRAHGATSRFVLLGSVATDKYVAPLAHVFGERLLFPVDFLGRGDMSRGAMLLRAARAGLELDYTPVEGTARHGPRATKLGTVLADVREVRASAQPSAASGPVELAIMIGLPGSGKTSFVRAHLTPSHLPVGGDMEDEGGTGAAVGTTMTRATGTLGRQPWAKQQQRIRDALRSGRSVVVDSTNVTPRERARIIAVARELGAHVCGYYLDCAISDCLERHQGRRGSARKPKVGLFAIASRLVEPELGEGFDRLYSVRPGAPGQFAVAQAQPQPPPQPPPHPQPNDGPSRSNR
jgi:predicted kinase